MRAMAAAAAAASSGVPGARCSGNAGAPARSDAGPETIEPVVRVEDEAVLMDSLILCKFLRGVFSDRLAGMAELLKPVTGWDITIEELLEIANRIVTTKKVYNISQGWNPSEDTLPLRFFEESLADGGSAGARIDSIQLAAQVEAYNLMRGWTTEGFVSGARRAALGLD